MHQAGTNQATVPVPAWNNTSTGTRGQQQSRTTGDHDVEGLWLPTPRALELLLAVRQCPHVCYFIPILSSAKICPATDHWPVYGSRAGHILLRNYGPGQAKLS